jgi:mxaA protein
MSPVAGTLRLAILLLVAVTSAIAAQQPTPARTDKPTQSAIVEQPRPFGYVVGDLLTQRVLLEAQGHDFEPKLPPPLQRVNIWFERRASKIERGADGRRWLEVEYQLINGPRELATISLPAWELDSKSANVKLGIPAAPISVASLISVDSAPNAGQLRPDLAVSIMDTAPVRAKLWAGSIALIVVLAAWLGWMQWRNWRDSLDRPFAHALHELRRIDETTPEAWQALHRAFDRTAGRVLQIETLPSLFDRAPYLQPQRAEIERFFAQSNQRFFGAGLQNNLISVRALCQELRRIERRHAR